MKFYYKNKRQTANEASWSRMTRVCFHTFFPMTGSPSFLPQFICFISSSFFCRHQFVLSLYSLDGWAIIWGILTVSGDTKLIVSIVRQHLKLPFVEIKSTAAELWVLRHLIWATVTIIYMLSIRNNNGFLWHVIGSVDQFEDWEEQPYQSVCGHSQHHHTALVSLPAAGSLSQWEKPPFFWDEIIALFWGIHRFYFCV